MPDVTGEGRYNTHRDCNNFIEYALQFHPYWYYEEQEDKYYVYEANGNIYTASCKYVENI